MHDPNVDPPRFATHGDVQLAYWDYGSGPHTVLLVMGINMRAAHWGAHFITALAGRHRVLCFDNRGTGSSTKPVEKISAELWAADAVAVLDAADVPRAHVLGTSMGGRVAQQLAVDHPARLERLLLLSSVFGGAEHVMGTREALQGFMPDPNLTPEQQRRQSLIAVTGPGFAEREPARLEQLVALGGTLRTPAQMLFKQLEVGRTHVADRLSGVHVPTLVVHGDSDGLVPMANGKLVHAAIPGARWELLPGIGHLPAWEAPEALLGLAFDFFS